MKRRREFLPKCIVYRRSEIRRIMLLVISFCFFASLMLQRHISNQLAKQLTSPTEDFLCSKNKFLVVHSSISDGEDSSGQNKRSILNKSPRWPKKKIDLLNISAAQIIQEFLNDPKSNSKILQPIDDEPSSSNNLPQWMEDYFSWHAMNRRRLTETNWKTTHKYLIIRCTKEDQKCGGLSDRLKPLPFFLLVAARTKRLLMIRWNKPAKLEEFLFPRNLNWSVPEWMEETIRNNETTVKFYRNAQKLAKRAKREKAVVIETRVQDMYGGSQIYEQILKGGDNSTVVQETYDVVYHDLFRALFSPAPPVAELIHEKMKAASLSPGEYAIAHYRAFYDIEHAKEKRSNKQIVAASINAVKCASELRPGGPVYFASDSKVAVDTVRKYANQENRSIVTFESEEALHIDRTDDWEARPASDFYSVFVDLFMMANGRCVTYGQGGFGRYALLLSYNATCESRHFYRGKQMKCEWKNLE